MNVLLRKFAAALLLFAAVGTVAAPSASASKHKKTTATLVVARLNTSTTYKWSQVVKVNSKGKQTWKVTSGSCKLSQKKKTITTSGAGTCRLRVKVAKWKSYRATTFYGWVDIEKFPTVLPQPVISPNSPPATISSYKPGYFTLTATVAGQTSLLDSTVTEKMPYSQLPDVSCYAANDRYATYSLTFTDANGSLDVEGTRGVYSFGEVLNGKITFTSPDGTRARFSYSKHTPTSTYSPDYGTGTIDVSMDGAGMMFDFTAVEIDSNYDVVPGGRTVSVKGYLTCSYEL
jgi:hypothetical protein